MLTPVRRVAEGLGDLVIQRGAWSVVATARGLCLAIALRMVLSVQDRDAIASRSAKDRLSVIRLIENVSCQGRTASLLELQGTGERLGAIVIEQRVFEPDGSAAMNQRIADAIQEVVITAVRVKWAFEKAMESARPPVAEGPRSDPGQMYG